MATPVRPRSGDELPPVGAASATLHSALARSQDQSRFQAPVIEKPVDKPPLPVKALLIGFVSVLALGILAGAIYVRFLREATPDPETVVKPTAQSSQHAKRQSPREVVTAYFEALGRGDIKAALALGARSGQGSTELLSPEAYAATAKRYPLRDLKIDSDDPASTSVRVRYTVGGEPVEDVVLLERVDDGYRMARTTITVRLKIISGHRLPVHINGQRLGDHSQALELVPGRYTPHTNAPFVDYRDPDQVLTFSRRGVVSVTLTPQLTDKGRATFLKKAKESLAACINSQELSPSGCPNQTRSRRPPTRIEWKLLSDPWGGVTPSLDPKDQSVAVLTIPLRTSVSVSFADGSTSPHNEENRQTRVSAPMLGSSEQAVTVTWG